ncbi:MAG TPA: ATP-binding protein [Gemmatimonadaceae bacterium]|nr:ATP-binding protein [Gemmatimonadaceae bacterium]
MPRWEPETELTRGENRLYRLLVESVMDYAIFALDPQGYILSWNVGAQRIKGYAAEEIIGKHFSIFYPQEKIDERFPWYELEVAAREGRFEDQGWRIRKDGSRFWANVIITALRDSAGTLVGFAKVTRDLTERRAAEERAIADARRIAESEAANRAKAEFLAAMSHELRTPLNAIGGYADLLIMGVGGELTEKQRKYIERVRGSQHHLLAIINDILNFSRLETGHLTYNIQPVSMHAVIDAVVPMIEPQATARQLHLQRVPCSDAIARADRAKVEQILINLLSNAVKFTPVGGHIDVECAAEGETVLLRVRDSGIGIPAEKLDVIFEPFVQVGRSLATPQEGTGLGLAISRDLARAMEGELLAESRPGAGSTFTLMLPAA